MPTPSPRRARRLALLLLTLTLALPVLPSTSASAADPTRSFGLTMAGVPGDMGPLRDLSGRLGRAPSTVMWYAAWATVADFPASQAAAVRASGATPEITWEPWDPRRGTRQATYTLDRIAQGRLDTYVKRWATQVKAYGGPLRLRFAHEMNGTWYPWAQAVNGGGAGDYVAAWRHVRDVFTAVGATNVTWVWSPNVPYTGSTPLAALYPGAAYVDAVALDGYNWSTLQGGSWQSFAQVFQPGITQLQQVAPGKPITIAETGSPETGGDKAAWIRDMFAWLAAHPEVRGFTWFQFDKEADWRIDSSPASLQAFKDGLATY